MTDNNSKGKLWSPPSWYFLWHHDTYRNGIEHNDIQFYNT
jgi:hypothetical protein